MRNIQKLIFYKKGYIDFCGQMAPSLKTVSSPMQMVFLFFFFCFRKYRFFRKTCLKIRKGYLNFLCKTPPFP